LIRRIIFRIFIKGDPNGEYKGHATTARNHSVCLAISLLIGLRRVNNQNWRYALDSICAEEHNK
jgi:hypothetical protein